MSANINLKDWQETQDDDYLKLCIERLSQPPLKWCEQFTDLINSNLSKSATSVSINEIGCNVGHFFRVLERIPISTNYIGFDISETYLNIARNSFPSGRFELLDITCSPPRTADISIVSATLEHLANWEDAFRIILDRTNNLVLLRTFAGKSSWDNFYCKSSAQVPYLIRQFTFEQLCEKAQLAGYTAQVVRDLATDSIPKYLGCGITRTQFVFIFKKF
jgi:hypothetical protein